ncbi:MAG: hypothetical protein EOO28_15880 [Comamonadaceae bacterium]|nr:MAG: hypothetical protein EOO28_15880 [Comamonadaceae bacterium]
MHCKPRIAALALALITGTAMAQSPAPAAAGAWPERAITLIVPFAPGASADALGRLLAQELSASLGKPVVVDNRPGAGGATGLIAVSKAPPDGYMLGMGATGAITINPNIPDAPPLEPQKQLAPIAKLADIPLLMVASAKSGFRNPKQVIDAARAKPDTLAYGSTGINTAQHLSGELFNQQAKTKLVHAPYRGSAPAVNDVLAGTTPLAIVDLTSAYQHVKAGTLVPIGVTTANRSIAAPEIPTLAEGGMTGYASGAWMGLFAPAGLPPALATRLTKEVQAILARPEIQARVMQLGAEPAYLDNVAFRSFIAAESQQWKNLIATVGQPAK